MAPSDTEDQGARGIPERLFDWAATISGLVLFAIMALVAVSVFFRYVLNAPILGAQELVQLGMVFVVMLGMPYTALHGQHVRVDFLDKYLGETGRFVCDVFARSVGIFVLWLLVRKSWDKMLDAREYEDVTNMIELPLWTAYAAICLGMGLYIFVLILHILRQFRAGRDGYE